MVRGVSDDTVLVVPAHALFSRWTLTQQLLPAEAHVNLL